MKTELSNRNRFGLFQFLRLAQEELVKKRWLLQSIKPTTTSTVNLRQISKKKMEFFFSR